jgi:hypothetical protein
MKHPIIIMFGFAAIMGASLLFGDECGYLVLIVAALIFVGTLMKKPVQRITRPSQF